MTAASRVVLVLVLAMFFGYHSKTSERLAEGARVSGVASPLAAVREGRMVAYSYWREHQ